MKKEYYLPLSIIIGSIIIGLFIYLGTTKQYRDLKTVCENTFYAKKFNKKDTKDLMVQLCIERGVALK